MGCPPQTFTVPHVTKIAISGPAPYNTLVVCLLVGPVATGSVLTRGQATVYSGYQLDGFNPDYPRPKFVHSTTAWVAATAALNENDNATGKDAWLYAVDDVPDAGFTSEGYFYVVVDTATMVPTPPLKFITWGDGSLIACSYVLTVEPQPGPPPRKTPPPRIPPPQGGPPPKIPSPPTEM